MIISHYTWFAAARAGRAGAMHARGGAPARRRAHADGGRSRVGAGGLGGDLSRSRSRCIYGSVWFREFLSAIEGERPMVSPQLHNVLAMGVGFLLIMGGYGAAPE